MNSSLIGPCDLTLIDLDDMRTRVRSVTGPFIIQTALSLISAIPFRDSSVVACSTDCSSAVTEMKLREK